MWYWLAFLALASALELEVVSPTRIDLVTKNYVHLDRLELCLNDKCVVKPCELKRRVIELDASDQWDCLRITYTMLRADGTTLRSKHVAEVNKPVPESLHIWYIVDVFVILAALAVLALVARQLPGMDKTYQSPNQKAQQLAQTLVGVYRGPVNVTDEHCNDNDDV